MVINSTRPDEELLRLIRAGDHQAFSELVTIHTDRFFALAFRTLNHRSDAEDVVQSVFIKIWKYPHAWQQGKSQFTTWLYRVVLNACYDHQRKHKNTVVVDQPILESIVPPIESEQHILEKKQENIHKQAQIEVAISKLPASQRDALNLVVYSELPQKQAARVMGISLKALESLLVRAKRSLKLRLSNKLVKTQIHKTAAID